MVVLRSFRFFDERMVCKELTKYLDGYWYRRLTNRKKPTQDMLEMAKEMPRSSMKAGPS